MSKTILAPARLELPATPRLAARPTCAAWAAVTITPAATPLLPAAPANTSDELGGNALFSLGSLDPRPAIPPGQDPSPFLLGLTPSPATAPPPAADAPAPPPTTPNAPQGTSPGSPPVPLGTSGPSSLGPDAGGGTGDPSGANPEGIILLEAGPDQEINEGQTVTIGPAVAYIGPLDLTAAYWIDWGDGTPPGPSLFLTNPDSHVYLDNGVYTVTVTASAWGIVPPGSQPPADVVDTLTVVVHNVDPVIAGLPSAASVDEGNEFIFQAIVHDDGALDDQTILVDWGDGTTSSLFLEAPDPLQGGGIPLGNPTAGANLAFALPRLFLDDDPSDSPADTYTVTVTAIDKDGARDLAEFEVTVNNLAPILGIDFDSATTEVNEMGGEATVDGWFFDAGIQDTFELTVDWGDGEPEVLQVAPGEFRVTHEYRDDNPSGTPFDLREVLLTVTDDDTGSASAVVPLRVNNVPPAVTSLVVGAGSFLATGVASVSGAFDDPGLEDTHTVVVAWGDGTSKVLELEQGERSFNAGSHTYPAHGPTDTYTVVVTVTDDDTGESQASSWFPAPPSPPNGRPDRYATPIDTPLGVASSGVLGNDWDPDGDALTASLIETTQHGQLVLYTDGSFLYVPDAGFVGTDVFKYAVSDGVFAASAPIFVWIDVWTVTKVEYSVAKSDGTVDDKNPNGGVGPAFGGGWRVFPDAKSYTDRINGHNLVRVVATVFPPVRGVEVFFRSFDVDDPSTDATIDPNDAGGVPTGRDNRGRLHQNLRWPVDSLLEGTPGYRGQLRTIGRIPSDPTWVTERGTGPAVTGLVAGAVVAEADLAVTFNPGDNFRVVASARRSDVEQLDDTTSVPTTGAVANLRGAASPQLSVWRKFHIERDRMQPIDWGWSASGRIGSVEAPEARGLPVITDPVILPPSAIGATVWMENGTRFVISAQDPTHPRRVFLVGASGTPLPEHNKRFVVYHGDWQSGHPDANGAWIPARVSAITAPVVGLVSISINLNTPEENEYQGGIIRIGGARNYLIFTNESSPVNQHDTLITIPSNDPILAQVGDTVAIYQDDFSPDTVRLGNDFSSTLTVVLDEGGGNYVVDLQVAPEQPSRFIGGVLWLEHTHYSITGMSSDDTGVHLQVSRRPGDPPPVTGSSAHLFRMVSNAQVGALVSVTDDSHLYGMLQPTTGMLDNKYSQAYLEPVYAELRPFSKGNVPGAAHMPAHAAAFSQFLDPYRGQDPGQGPARPGNYETDFFWSTYVCTAFEAGLHDDFDPAVGRVLLGVQGRPGPGPEDENIALIYLESIRDYASAHGVSEDFNRSALPVHEIGHQFQLAYQSNENDPNHRDATHNIMSSFVVAADDFHFHPRDLVGIRRRIHNPDGRPIP